MLKRILEPEVMDTTRTRVNTTRWTTRRSTRCLSRFARGCCWVADHRSTTVASSTSALAPPKSPSSSAAAPAGPHHRRRRRGKHGGIGPQNVAAANLDRPNRVASADAKEFAVRRRSLTPSSATASSIISPNRGRDRQGDSTHRPRRPSVPPRPGSTGRRSAARQLVATYASDATPYQRKLFGESLLPRSRSTKCRNLVAGFDFSAETVQMTSDRHWTWSVRRP